MEACSLLLLLHLLLATCILKGISLLVWEVLFWKLSSCFSAQVVYIAASSILMSCLSDTKWDVLWNICALTFEYWMPVLVQTQHTIMWWEKKKRKKRLWLGKSSWQREVPCCSVSYWNGTEFSFIRCAFEVEMIQWSPMSISVGS